MQNTCMDPSKYPYSSHTTVKIPGLKNLETVFRVKCRTWNYYLR